MIGKIKCKRCKNFIGGEVRPDTWTCKAFLDGIPYEKTSNIMRDPCIDCNNGIGFEPKEEEKAD